MKRIPAVKSLCLATVVGLCVSGGLAEERVFAQPQSAEGCPAWGNPGGNPGVRFVGLMSPLDAVARSTEQITDAWYDQQGIDEEEFLAARLARATEADKNGDGLLCVALTWGAELNPHSHWAQIWADTLDPPFSEAVLISDNHTGRSNER
jgi:hypothetical protein